MLGAVTSFESQRNGFCTAMTSKVNNFAILGTGGKDSAWVASYFLIESVRDQEF